MTREELINEDWGKEYSKLADLYAKKCKEVRELKEKNKQIRAEVIDEIYNEIVYIENKFRSMLLNTTQEDNVVEWVDLNGKLMAITTIKHLIRDKLKEQK